jgi:cell wall-associated NlpC family hydrolase
MHKLPVSLIILALLAFVAVPAGGCKSVPPAPDSNVVAPALPAPASPSPAGSNCDSATLTADFTERDKIPQSDAPQAGWYSQSSTWGPDATRYQQVQIPSGCDPVSWKRQRIIAVARKYIGLNYQHHHIPAWNPAGVGTGLDCSNFTSWVYNYGLGIYFTSDVHDQADSSGAPGRKLSPQEPLQPGDLLYILKGDRSAVSHVAIYVDPTHIIDSHGEYHGVTEHAATGWYVTHFAFARRIIE